MENEIIISNDELKEMIREGYFFNFCVGFALNKGHKDAIKQKKEVKFSVGDFEVKFDPDNMDFTLHHKNSFTFILVATFHGVQFVGDDENEMITDLLLEFEKEIEATSK
jgi:hypothetical protein